MCNYQHFGRPLFLMSCTEILTSHVSYSVLYIFASDPPMTCGASYSTVWSADGEPAVVSHRSSPGDLRLFALDCWNCMLTPSDNNQSPVRWPARQTQASGFQEDTQKGRHRSKSRSDVGHSVCVCGPECSSYGVRLCRQTSVFEDIRSTVYLWTLEGGIWFEAKSFSSSVWRNYMMVRVGERARPPSKQVVWRSATSAKQQVQVSSRFLSTFSCRTWTPVMRIFLYDSTLQVSTVDRSAWISLLEIFLGNLN